ncbi:MAG: xanthine dehydrogenase family protein subunit M [Dehalococcoidia bacterium]|jgi:CO/xanthine dehydrogenase FAD-binding subunit|nr:xanthine dehydrogenase family protein subunit M [Dehalococcoidia bacterium]MDP6226880.1 xanthine dehydrogenase family protein subunit M [Dehalococcoidia bacterium]HJN88597.1 xanthine dehydrogenase family protein subunit M [Dehalococcoidia bacterium]
MKPAPFEYFAPESLAEALDLLRQRAGDARVLAGGQSLVPLLSFRLVKPAALVDINGLSQLSYIRRDDGRRDDGRRDVGYIAIGAGTRQRQVLASDDVSEMCPLLSEAVSYIGHPAIRNRGTVGGSIAHADPAAELPVVAAALDAEMVVHSSRGERSLKPEEFFVTFLTTAMEPDEILAEVRFPFLGPRTGASFQEVSRRHGDYALVAVAATVTLDKRGHCQSARVALGGVGGTPVRARAVEQAITGSEPTEAALAEAAQLVKGEIDPATDIHASAEYRGHVASVLVRRALQSAAERARAQ